MTKLTNPVAILSRSNGAAQLIAIDTEAKTCTIYNGKEKIIKWSSAAEYKLDAGTEKKRTLTPKLLTALHDAESVHYAEDTAADPEAVREPVNEPAGKPQGVTQDAAPEESTPAASDTQEAAGLPKAKRQRTPKGTINDKEKAFLSMIPSHPEFKGVDSVMGARVLIKKAQEVHGLPIPNGRAVFQSLKAKGYYSTKGKESGQNLTTFQLLNLGIQYLTENSLIAADSVEGKEGA